MRIAGSHVLVLALLLVGCESSMPFVKAPRVTGTFSDMFVHEPTDEVLGTEIRIVRTQTGLQGTLQIGGGDLTGLSELVVVDVYHEDGRIWFTIPDHHRWAGTFSGELKRSGLVGSFTLDSGEERFVVLERTRSIWD